jgi:hypothetical protein
MPLSDYLRELERPVQSDETQHVFTYMKKLAPSKEVLVIQCAEHLEKNKTRSALLAVAYALNGGEILLKCQDDLDHELSSEFDKLLSEVDEKK